MGVGRRGGYGRSWGRVGDECDQDTVYTILNKLIKNYIFKIIFKISKYIF